MNQRIGIIAKNPRVKLTNQMLADLALEQDQARRAALKTGNLESARVHSAEVKRLARRIK